VPVRRLALVAIAAATLALPGCGQDPDASDTVSPLPADRPVAEPTIIRTPTRVDEAPLTVERRRPESEASGEHGAEGS
jgi:hypothetical protein